MSSKSELSKKWDIRIAALERSLELDADVLSKGETELLKQQINNLKEMRKDFEDTAKPEYRHALRNLYERGMKHPDFRYAHPFNESALIAAQKLLNKK